MHAFDRIAGFPRHCALQSRCAAWSVGAVLLALPSFGQADERNTVEVLETPSFVVRIEVHCEDGGGCEDARYLGTNKRTGRALSLSGAPAYRPCADGVTPCQWTGYKFLTGSYTYFVSLGGVLRIERRGKLLLQEDGVWRQ